MAISSWRVVVTFAFLVITFGNLISSDNFDITRQGGDRPMPTGTGSAAWWLLTNGSVLPNFSWPNSSANVTPALPLWSNSGSAVPIWPLGATSNPAVVSIVPWSSGGSDVFGVTPTPGTSTIGSNANATVSWLNFINESAAVIGSNFVQVGSSQNSWQGFVSNSTPAPYRNMSFESARWPPLLYNMSNSTSTPAPPNSTREPKEPPIDQYVSFCRKHSESELYNLLQDGGGYNQYFMANSPDEVGLLPGFKLADDATENANVQSDATKRIQRSPAVDALTKRVCSGRCKRISLIVQNALRDSDYFLASSIDKTLARDAYDNVWSNKSLPVETTGPSLTSTPTTTTTNETRKTTKSGQKPGAGLCSLDKFIPIGQCDQRGEEEFTGLQRLCTACRGVYRLANGCFPQFLNAITCNSTDVRCIFDLWTPSHEPHGTCQEKTITITVMHNLGTDQCQDWHYESISVPVACQCYLNKSSWLKAV